MLMSVAHLGLSLQTTPPPATAWRTAASPTARQLAAAKEAGELSLWGSASPRARPVALWELKLFFKADEDMQEQLGLRGTKDQDSTFGAIAGIAVAGLLLSTVVEASELPPPVKLPLGAVCSLAPFLAITAGVAIPDELSALRRLSPVYRRRQNYHEAGHFAVGHLLGLEVDSYNSASADGAGAEVVFASPFTRTSRSHDVLDRVAVLAMAGVAAEVLACGDAAGGFTDVAQLRGLMETAAPPITARREQDDRIRWATLMALTLLENNRGRLDALAARFESAPPVGSLVRCLEGVEEEK